MMSPLFALAIAAARMWTRLYTWRLAPALRAARRAEIESDVWEMQHDAEPGHGLNPGLHVLGRLLFGMPHDVCWRVEQAAPDGRAVARSIALTATAAALLLAALWAWPLLLPDTLPETPARRAFVSKAPPPPPPPPPPCAPPGFPRNCPQ